MAHQKFWKMFYGPSIYAKNISWPPQNPLPPLSVVTLSAKDNQNPAKFLRKGLQRSVYWNEYKVEKQLIVGATKTVKHKIKNQEGGFDVT